MKRFITITLGALISTASFAASVDFYANTAKGRQIRFNFEGSPNLDTHYVTVCVQPGQSNLPHSPLKKLALWMKMGSHQHGSDPTVVHPAQANGCSLVQELNFSMTGKWEIHVRLADGDTTGDHPLEVMVGDSSVGGDL